jgi:type I restriction enzyme R subunit
MIKVGQIELATENCTVQSFQEQLQYDYLANWEERQGNSNILGTIGSK